jgi:hypothetical protein
MKTSNQHHPSASWSAAPVLPPALPAICHQDDANPLRPSNLQRSSTLRLRARLSPTLPPEPSFTVHKRSQPTAERVPHMPETKRTPDALRSWVDGCQILSGTCQRGRLPSESPDEDLEPTSPQRFQVSSSDVTTSATSHLSPRRRQSIETLEPPAVFDPASSRPTEPDVAARTVVHRSQRIITDCRAGAPSRVDEVHSRCPRIPV